MKTRTTKSALANARHAAIEAQIELLKVRDRDGKTFAEREDANVLIEELRRIQILIAEYEERN